MRAISALLFLSIVIMAAETTDKKGEDFNSDFFQGMENGFFLRDNLEAHKEYECPDLVVPENMIKTLENVFSPVKMVLGMVQNEAYSKMWNIVETMIQSIIKLTATVHNYPGSEYCSGLLFGMHGSAMLVSIGKNILDMLDTIDNMKNKSADKPAVAKDDKEEFTN